MNPHGFDLRDALKSFYSGVTIVTAADAEGTPFGCTVSSFASLSLEPPLVLVCLGREVRSLEPIRARQAYAVHILDRTQAELARRFAADTETKFEGLAFQPNEDGVPLLEDCRLRLECRVETEYDGGDHVIVVGRVRAVGLVERFEPLIFGNRAFATLGPAAE